MSKHQITVKNKQAFIDLDDGSYNVDAYVYKKRSLDQNGYYWSCVVPHVRDGMINEGWRMNIEQTHNELKERFLQEEIVNEVTGEIKTIQRDTKGLSTVEFEEYLAKIKEMAAEYLSITIPDPGEQISIFNN
jgi:hypothetical protein